jgi:hypothetical protein
MSWFSIVLVVGLIISVVVRRVHGEAVPAPKKLFRLPVVVAVIGIASLTHRTLNSIDVAVIAVGCAVSLALGLVRGRLDTVSRVNGVPTMAWNIGSLAVLVVNVVTKVALDAGGVAVGATAAALSSSLLVSLGLTLLGEAVVVWHRAEALPPHDPSTSQYGEAVAFLPPSEHRPGIG